MFSTKRNPVAREHDGARKYDHAGTLTVSEDNPFRANIQTPPAFQRSSDGCADSQNDSWIHIGGVADRIVEALAKKSYWGGPTMTLSQISAQFEQCASLSSEVLGALLRRGVDLEAICRRVKNGNLADPPRQGPVVYFSGGGFEFAACEPGSIGRLAIIFVIRNHLGDPIDLAAWSGGKRRPALWCARGALLGEENLFVPRMTEGLLVHPSPIEWLRAACNGVAVLDDSKAAYLLRRAEPLEASSIPHGQALARILEVRRPRILVPSPTSRRAV
jgi:hypothetical protein